MQFNDEFYKKADARLSQVRTYPDQFKNYLKSPAFFGLNASFILGAISKPYSVKKTTANGGEVSVDKVKIVLVISEDTTTSGGRIYKQEWNAAEKKFIQEGEGEEVEAKFYPKGTGVALIHVVSGAGATKYDVEAYEKDIKQLMFALPPELIKGKSGRQVHDDLITNKYLGAEIQVKSIGRIKDTKQVESEETVTVKGKPVTIKEYKKIRVSMLYFDRTANPIATSTGVQILREAGATYSMDPELDKDQAQYELDNAVSSEEIPF